jgi:antitoxin CptB
MAEADLAAFERLMEEPDPDLFARFAAGGDAPPGADPALWRRIGAFHAARKPVHS